MALLHRSLLVVGLGSLLAGPIPAAGNEQALVQRQLRQAPSDIVALAGREAACRHWLNIEVTDEASDTLVEHALGRLGCDSLAADVESLQKKYAQSAPALKALDTARGLGA